MIKNTCNSNIAKFRLTDNNENNYYFESWNYAYDAWTSNNSFKIWAEHYDNAWHEKVNKDNI